MDDANKRDENDRLRDAVAVLYASRPDPLAAITAAYNVYLRQIVADGVLLMSRTPEPSAKQVAAARRIADKLARGAYSLRKGDTATAYKRALAEE